jgi:2-polyprenyl-6-methoxyphenol hydroxylase-like FAD-dependent oxidoreductase
LVAGGRPEEVQMTTLGEHAIVLGASLAGLATAAAVADRFDRVTIVERDALPPTGEHRRGVPHGRHVQVLLPAGLRGLATLLPGLLDDLRSQGAHVVDARTGLRFHLGGGSIRMDGAGWDFLSATRPLIEGVVRERVRALPGVRFVERCDVRGLVASTDRSTVTGVRLRSQADRGVEKVATADLVVDATGRGSQSGRWLVELGYPAPEEERLNVGVHYTSRLFRAPPEVFDGLRSVVVGMLPDGRRGGTAQAVEADRWLVTLVGMLGERPPTDLDGFTGYASGLWATDIHDLVAKSEPVGEAATGAFPAYLRRRYDRLRRLPERFVVAGDAACSLNPAYAQGMSVAVGEAVALSAALGRHGLDRVGRRFFRDTRRIVDNAWSLATGADLAHAEVEGPRRASWRLINTYLGRALPVAHRDPVVGRVLMEVNSLVVPPGRLLHPGIAWRVFRPGFIRADQPARR